MSDGKRAARLLDELSHTSALSGFLGGALLGLAAGIAIVAVTVATGGAALAVVAAAGAAAATTGGTALLGGAFGATFSSPCGTIAPTCSTNVIINNRPAARSVLDGVLCSVHAPGPPKPIATGAKTILINGFPAARIDEKTVCGGKISSGSENVIYGGPSGQMLDIASEIPGWMTTTAQVLLIGGTIVAVGAGAAAAYVGGGLCALAGFAGETIGAFALGFVGSEVGGHIGEALGGERGRIIGSTIGGFIGGFFGAKLGGRMTRGHPVDMASGELFTEAIDFELPGPIPLVFSRVWMSSSSETGRTGYLGSKWHHSFGVRLHYETESGTFFLRMEDGRLATFTPPLPGSASLNSVERLLLETDGKAYRARDYLGQSWVLRPSPVQPDIWLLDARTDANGNQIRFSYDDRGALARITDSAGRLLNVETDDQLRIRTIDAPHPVETRARMVLARYRYNGDGDLVSVRDARGNSFAYTYENHLLKSEKRRGGLTYFFEWDDISRSADARCSRTYGTSASGNTTGLYYVDMVYDDRRYETLVRDASGNITRYRNDGLGKVAKQTDPDGMVTKFAYDVAGNLTLSKDGFGNSTAQSFDKFGRLISSREADGTGSSFGYGDWLPTDLRFGSPELIKKSDTGEHRFQYDERGNVEIYFDSGGSSHKYLRDDRGYPLAIIDGEGTAWRWQWSRAGDLTGEGPDALRRRYSYDKLGRLSAIDSADGESAVFARDANGNLVQMRLEDGRSVKMEYNAEDQISLHIDPIGRTASWKYDGLCYPVEKIEPGGAVIRYQYDAEMRPVRLANAANKQHRLQYDFRGQIASETGFDGKTTTFHYNKSNHLERVVDGGIVSKFERDKLGRVVEKLFADGSVHKFSWAGNNRIATASTEDCSLKFKYDAMQRIISEFQDDFEIKHQYDARGRLTSTLLQDGETIDYSYTATDECSEIKFCGNSVAKYGHDIAGRVVRRISGPAVFQSEFDPQGRLTRQSVVSSGSKGRRDIVSRNYSYRGDNNIDQIDDSARGTLNYRFDERERLTSTTGWAPERFIYDLTDNLVAVLAAEDTGDDLSGIQAAEGNRIAVFGDRKFSYDSRGNLVREASGQGGRVVTEYSYRSNDMLSEVKRSDWRGETVSQYGYDAFNRRVSKSITTFSDAGNDEKLSATEEFTRYLWNGDVLLAESNDRKDPVKTVYLYDLYSFHPLALLKRGSGNRYNTCYYNNDHLGTPSELIDEDGKIVWSATYRAWGVARIHSRDNLVQPLRFPGQYYDEESGLHYNRNRYYHPQIGRYTQPDPISLLGGMNAYMYGLNPVGYIDSFGLTGEGANNHSVYHILNNKTGEVVYVGRTTDVNSTTSRHRGTGRLGRGYRLEVQESGLSRAQAKGYEQAGIKTHIGEPRTDRIGKPIRAGEPNRIWSYDDSRTDKRADSYKKHYEERMKQLGKC